MSIFIIGFDGVFPNKFDVEKLSEQSQSQFISGTIDVDLDAEFLPHRSDEKIMRSDIKVSVVSIRKILKDIGLDASESIEKMALFVANGAFISDTQRYMKRISIYKTFPDDISEEEKLYKIYRASPPLLALETLTNSSMSFIAQYTGVKGNNTTYGNTSLSAYYAVQEAIETLKKDSNTNAIICASNAGGVYSFLSNSAVVGYKKGWKESAAIGNLVLSKKSENAFCKITKMSTGINIPNLGDQTIHRAWSTIVPSDAQCVIYSGAFCEQTSKLDRLYCEKFFKKSLSLFADAGNMGSSNLIMGMIKGINLLKEIPFVDIVDRDVYGRESHIRIEKC